MLSGPDPTPGGGSVRMVIAGDPASVREGLLALADAALFRRLSQADRGTAELVLGEVLNNIVEHAYAQGPGLIDLRLDLAADGICCRVIDQGLAMPGDRAPPGTPPAGMDGPIADLPEGGFGWFLIRSLTRDLSYRRLNARNHLRFTLPVAAEPG